MVFRFSISEVTPATAISSPISIIDINTKYCGDSSVLVFGSVFVIVNCATNVGNSTEMRVLRRSVKLVCVMRKQVKPMRVSTMGGTIV